MPHDTILVYRKNKKVKAKVISDGDNILYISPSNKIEINLFDISNVNHCNFFKSLHNKAVESYNKYYNDFIQKPENSNLSNSTFLITKLNIEFSKVVLNGMSFEGLKNEVFFDNKKYSEKTILFKNQELKNKSTLIFAEKLERYKMDQITYFNTQIKQIKNFCDKKNRMLFVGKNITPRPKPVFKTVQQDRTVLRDLLQGSTHRELPLLFRGSVQTTRHSPSGVHERAFESRHQRFHEISKRTFLQ
jgi:hypothetical protein